MIKKTLETFARTGSRNGRRSTSNQQQTYEALEPRQMLAVTAMFDNGALNIELNLPGDTAIVDVDQGNVTVNGELVDTDSEQAGIQAAAVADVTNLTFTAESGVTDAAVELNGLFDSGSLISLSLNDINQVLLNGSYTTASLLGTLVGDDGSIAGGGSITVSSLTNLTSVNAVDVDLSNGDNDFGGLVNITTEGDVSLADSNNLTLGIVDVGGNLTVSTPGGFIADSVGSNVTVDVITEFNALFVDLDDSSHNLFVVVADVTGGFNLVEEDIVFFDQENSLGGLNITAETVGMGMSATLNIFGDAVYNVGSVKLGIGGSNTYNAETTNFVAEFDVFLWENSNIDLVGTNTANNVDLLTSSSISNAAGSSLVATNIAAFQASGDINIGNAVDDTFRAGSIRFYGGNVQIAEDNSMVVGGLANLASSLTLSADGSITDESDTFIAVTNNATFLSEVTDPKAKRIAGVVLGDTNNDFFGAGSVSFNVVDGNFLLFENSSTVLTSIDGFMNSATAARIDPTGMLTNTENTLVDVATNAVFNASEIDLGQQTGDSLNFGAVSITSSGNVSLFEDSGVFFTQNSFVGGDLTVNSTGSIGDSAISQLNVIGNAAFNGTGINLGGDEPPADPDGDGNLFNAGTLSFLSDGMVDITENSSMVLAGSTMHAASEARLATATEVSKGGDEGTITNEAGAMLTVDTDLMLEAVNDIILGTDAADLINFANLNFQTSANVEITANFSEPDAAFLLFGNGEDSNRAAELRLTTNADVFDGDAAQTVVTDFIRIEARNIVLGDTKTDCLVIPDGENREIVTSGKTELITTDETC